jgi:DUF971 family protein
MGRSMRRNGGLRACSRHLQMDAQDPPEQIIVSADRSELRLVWPGSTLALSAPRLRAACRCADCRRARIDHDADLVTEGVALADVRLVGDHALNITFSDGHDRGIYPWSYLLELAHRGDAGGG